MDLLTFAKGHGTGNDFVLLPDFDGELPLTPALVAALCDRRRGLGGDGLLRVVRSRAHPEAADRAEQAEWFLDYWNGDGSAAQMCGNGARVYARYLTEAGLAAGPRIPIMTRAGLVVAEEAAGGFAVDMPMTRVYGQSSVTLDGEVYAGTVVVCGNPNLVCPVADPDALDLTRALILDASAFPAGANVEFVRITGPGRVRMRVVERGVGETFSCGSGACAVAAWLKHSAAGDDPGGPVTVDVPGGRLTVSIGDDQCVLTGHAVIVGYGEIRLDSLMLG